MSEFPNMDLPDGEDISGPSSLSSDQASLCVIPDPDDSSEEDGFIYLDKSSLPASLNVSEQDRAVIVFHSVDEEYPSNQDVVCQYIRPEGWEEDSKDQICLFKVGWVTKHDAVFTLPLPQPSNDPIGQILIPDVMLPKDTSDLYQFCYMREYTLLGASTPFQFSLPNAKPCVSGSSEVTCDQVVKKAHDCVCSRTESLSTLNLSGCSENSKTKINLKAEQPPPSGKVECVLQPCKEIPQLISAIYKDLETSGCCADRRAEGNNLTSLIDVIDRSMGIKSNTFIEENGQNLTLEVPVCSEVVHGSNPIEKDISKQTDEVGELSSLQQYVKETAEEKKWLQEQYDSLLVSVSDYAGDLTAERAEKESLNNHVAELTANHKRLYFENTRLSKELDDVKSQLNENSSIFAYEKHHLQRQLQDLLSENARLKSEAELSHSHKEVESGKVQSECMCDKYKKQVEDLTARVSDYEVMRNCLEVELEEEMKLGQEKDSYLVHMEQLKINNLQMANNWLASTPNDTASGNTLLEMEENVNSTLQALECALKEMEVLRSRQKVLSKANRVLREDLMQKRSEWEERMTKQQSEFDDVVSSLQKELKCERSAKDALHHEIEDLSKQLGRQRQNQTRQQDLSDALVVSRSQIETLRRENSDLDMECTYLRKKSGSEGMEEDMIKTLMKNLQEAKEEYTKLYTEKMRVQEKLSKLQQKVKTKKISRAHHEANASIRPEIDFMNNVSSSWRATIDELM